MAKKTAKLSSVWKVKIDSFKDRQTGAEHPTLGFWAEKHRNWTESRPISYGRMRWEALLAVMDSQENRDKVRKWLATQARRDAAAQSADNKTKQATGRPSDIDPKLLAALVAQLGLQLVPAEADPSDTVDEVDDDTDKL